MGGDGSGLEAVTDELYAVDPADFVSARNELVRRLRQAGDRQLAAEVGKLRRPSPAAWAVNQLARRHRSDLEELVRLGELLRAAQDRALGGAESGQLRQAARARRDAVARLTDVATGILAERGGSPVAHAGEVAATLEAASLDAEAGAAVLAGRLSSDLQPPSGFGSLDLPAVHADVAPQALPPPPELEPDPHRRELEEAREEAAEATRRWEERSAQARAAVDRVGESRRSVRDAESEVARLEELLAEAERRLRRAVRDAEQAEDTAARAEEAADKAAGRLRAADARVAELGGG